MRGGLSNMAMEMPLLIGGVTVRTSEHLFQALCGLRTLPSCPSRPTTFDSISDTVYNAWVADECGELTIEELADGAGVSVRTVRYYISQGLLAGPGARGRNASYTDEHLARLQLIRRLVEQHVPLAEQRQQLEGLSYQQVRALLKDEERHGKALDRAS